MGKDYRVNFTDELLHMNPAGWDEEVENAPVDAYGLDESCLWFNAKLERLQKSGFLRLATAYPSAVLQYPVSFLAPLILSASLEHVIR